VTTKAKKPDVTSKSFLETIKELQNTIEAVNEIRVANRASEFFPHLSTVSEGIPMLGWVTIDRKPADYVTEMLNSAQFYGNKVLKEYKEK
jgi:adenylyl cyclase-associated protein